MSSPSGAADDTVDADPEVAARLRAWRLDLSREQGKPAFTVLTNAVLDAVAATRPRTENQLLAVEGMGPKKVDAYGAEILRVVRGE